MESASENALISHVAWVSVRLMKCLCRCAHVAWMSIMQMESARECAHILIPHGGLDAWVSIRQSIWHVQSIRSSIVDVDFSCW